MPVVQTPGRQVTTAPLTAAPQVTQANVPALGADIGGALNQVGQNFLRRSLQIEEDERRRQNRVAVLAADNAVSGWIIENIHGRALQTQRGGALNITDEYLGLYDEFVSGVASDALHNPEQRATFNEHVAAFREDAYQRLLTHSLSESRAFDDEETVALTNNAMSLAIQNAEFPELAEGQIDFGISAILANAADNELGPQLTGQMVTQFESQARTGIIYHLLDSGNDISAQQYYDRWKDTILDQGAVESRLKTQGTNGAGQRLAEEVLPNVETREDGLNMIRAATDDQGVEDQAVARFNVMWTEKENAQQDAKDENFTSTTNAIRNAGDTATRLRIRDTLRDIDEWNKADALITRLAQGLPVVTDNEVYSALNNLYITDPDAFMQVHIPSFDGVLSQADIQEFERLKRSLVDDSDDDPLNINLNTTLQGLIESAVGSNDSDEFWSAYRGAVNELRAPDVNGRPKDIDINNVFDAVRKWTMEVKIDRPGLNPTRLRAEVLEGEEFYVRQIPDDIQAEIRSAFQQDFGMALTDIAATTVAIQLGIIGPDESITAAQFLVWQFETTLGVDLGKPRAAPGPVSPRARANR